MQYNARNQNGAPKVTVSVVVVHAEPSFADGIAACEPARSGRIETLAFASADDAIPHAGEAEIVMGLAQTVSQRLVDAMPRLRWIQAFTTGVDPLERLRLPAGTIVTSARGVHGPQMTELAFLLMLALLRKLPQMLANQARAHWQRWPQPLLFGKTIVIVGVGAIGEELAARCQAFGMRVLGVSGGRASAPHFDRMFPRAGLVQAAAEADFLVVLAPYTAANHHLVDAAAIAALPARAVLINLARGNVVDEAALIEALAHHRIAGAGVDVFATEPLPPESPFWRLPNVIVTPHIGGFSDIYAQQVLPAVIENLELYIGGKSNALRNLCWIEGVAR
jgi:phosphoglycerate dehydrogenase-like enzyme